jgi:hypothetical protein
MKYNIRFSESVDYDYEVEALTESEARAFVENFHKQCKVTSNSKYKFTYVIPITSPEVK